MSKSDSRPIFWAGHLSMIGSNGLDDGARTRDLCRMNLCPNKDLPHE